MRLFFFLPSYNDHEALPGLVEDLLAQFPSAQIFILDDGSDFPVTEPISNKVLERVTVYRLEQNQGLGLATSIAIDFFLSSDTTHFVRLDSDGQHPVSFVPFLIKPLIEEEVDLAWGERINRGSGARGTPLRLLGQKWTELTAKVFLRARHADWYSGFFAMNRKAAKFFQETHLERYCEVQLLCLAYSGGLQVATVPVVQNERTHGESSIRLFKGVMLVLRACLIIVLHTNRGSTKPMRALRWF